MLGLIGAPPNTRMVAGDELADAKAKQAALKKDIAAQKAKVAQINSLQSALSSEIRATKAQLNSIGVDLTAVRKKIVKMESRIEEVKHAYADLIVQVSTMDAQVRTLVGQEAKRQQQLTERRALLADRVRNAYDTDRTSPLETLLSSGTFTDMLAEMSFYIDVGEQDKALANQITKDKEALAVLRETVTAARDRTNVLRQETAQQKRELDASLLDLKDTRATLKKLEKAVSKALREQKARYAQLLRNKKNAARIIRQAAAKQAALSRQIDKLINEQVNKGKIPSQYNGTFRWPMDHFTVSGEYGCSSFAYYAPGHGCAHYHNGIDLVAPSGTAGPGRRRRHGRLHRLELGRRRGSGLDRGHRPLGLAADVVRPHAAQTPGVGGTVGQEGPGHRLRGRHRPRDRAAPPLDGRAEPLLRESAQVPVMDGGRRRPVGARMFTVR